MNDTTRSADALVMFGLTGDLGAKKLLPALYELAAADRLGIPVVGVGRTEYSDDDVRQMLNEALADHRPADGSEVDQAIADGIDLRYVAGDSTDSSTFDSIVDLLDGADHVVVYAALPPDLFGDVARGLAESRLADTTRLVVEKPFGKDVDSARALHQEISEALGGDRLFIVDHFLAKAAIENMTTLRSTNPLIDNSMCTQFVESIEVLMKESGGVDGRGSFYEGVGAVDDVLQNHLLQTLALLMMDAPTDDSYEAYETARTALLRAVRPIRPEDVVLGQYEGYRELDDVDDESQVETFVDVELTVDSDRWRDVPVRIRTGKRLDEDLTTATITMRRGNGGDGAVTNRIVFHVKPASHVSIELGVLDPETHEATPTSIDVCAPPDHGDLGDYATMLSNALEGKRRHFASIDGVVEAWRIVADVKTEATLVRYEPDSSGPQR